MPLIFSPTDIRVVVLQKVRHFLHRAGVPEPHLPSLGRRRPGSGGRLAWVSSGRRRSWRGRGSRQCGRWRGRGRRWSMWRGDSKWKHGTERQQWRTRERRGEGLVGRPAPLFLTWSVKSVPIFFFPLPPIIFMSV